MRGDEDGENEEESTDRAPEAAVVDLGRGEALRGGEEEGGPGGAVGIVGWLGHED